MEKRKVRRVWLIVAVAVCVSIVLGVLFTSAIPDDQITNLDNASIMISFCGPYDKYSGFGLHNTLFYFYDSDGSVVDSYMENETVSDFCAVEGGNKTFLFFKNHSVVASQEETVKLDNSSGTTLTYPSFSPSEVGYIEELDVAYALLNVGRLPESDEYINIVRFTSSDKSYDVILPYFIDDISYDESERTFVCWINRVTFPEEYRGASALCVTLEYNPVNGEFIKGDTFKLTNPIGHAGTELFSFVLAKDKMLYVVSNRMLSSAEFEYPERMYLDIYDLSNHTLVEQKVLLDCYDGGKYGHGVMSGINSKPSLEQNGTLYVFTSDFQVIAVSGASSIEYYSMPFVFEDSRERYNPQDTDVRTDFSGSAVSVGSDGRIYVLNLYPDNLVKIHQLNEDGSYELFWEGICPFVASLGYKIRGFEILNIDPVVSESVSRLPELM